MPWGCSAYWVWAVTTPLGSGCIDCGGPWSALGEIGSTVWSRWTRFSLAESVRESAAVEQVAKLWWSSQRNKRKKALAESDWVESLTLPARAWSRPSNRWSNPERKCIRTGGAGITGFL